MEESERPSSPSGVEAPAKGRRPAPLTQERVNLLNALGFTWTIRSRDALGESWNQRFQELRQYKQQNGHCQVPSRYDKNPELGIWVGTQRSQYRLFMRARETGQSISTNMNDDRIRELEDLGFVWALRGSMPEDAAFAAAVEIADKLLKNPELMPNSIYPLYLQEGKFLFSKHELKQKNITLPKSISDETTFLG